MYKTKSKTMQYDSFLFEDFSLYEKKILPVILAEQSVLQKPFGYHGLLTHTRSVVFRGIDYCLSLSQDVMPVILACAFHDLAKGYDGYDEEHGTNAVPIAQKIIPKLDLDLSNEQIDMIFDAIKDHTTGMNAQNYVSGCLWDADRTRLSWQYTYDEKFYYSPRAKQVASGSPYDYVRYMCRLTDIPFTNDLLVYWWAIIFAKFRDPSEFLFSIHFYWLVYHFLEVLLFLKHYLYLGYFKNLLKTFSYLGS